MIYIETGLERNELSCKKPAQCRNWSAFSTGGSDQIAVRLHNPCHMYVTNVRILLIDNDLTLMTLPLNGGTDEILLKRLALDSI